MTHVLGLLETIGATPAMVAIDSMVKSATVRVLQIELNDLCGVFVIISGGTSDVQTAIDAGRKVAEAMGGKPETCIITRVTDSSLPGIFSHPEFNPLIQQDVVFNGPDCSPPEKSSDPRTVSEKHTMNQEHPMALGFIETQGFTAVIEAVDTACKAADVQVVAKEKLGGGYVTIVLQGELSAVTTAIDSGKARVEGLGQLIAAHTIARPCEGILSLLPKV